MYVYNIDIYGYVYSLAAYESLHSVLSSIPTAGEDSNPEVAALTSRTNDPLRFCFFGRCFNFSKTVFIVAGLANQAMSGHITE